jgi:hypothetical protein
VLQQSQGIGCTQRRTEAKDGADIQFVPKEHRMLRREDGYFRGGRFMLEKTFLHLPGVGEKTERSLWEEGIHSWDIFCDEGRCTLPFGKKKSAALRFSLAECREALQNCSPEFFARSLPHQFLWRLFPDFRDCVAYLDIETTGLGGPPFDHITTAALYDGREVSYYVYGQDLERFRDDLQKYKILISYNGKCFDVPFINDYFGITLDQVHIDLRYLLSSLGYRGGLKGCEKKLGIGRDELDGVDGFFGVLLWEEYKRKNDLKALETLLAYNIADAVNLEALMVKAYNLKLLETPFLELRLPLPSSPALPFSPHAECICRLREIHGIF